MNEERLNFYQIFRINPDGSIEPIQIIKIGGVQIGPGVKLGRGVFFSGIDLGMYVGRDFLVNKQDGVSVIKGIF